MGADVTVVAANVALPRHPRVRYVDVETAAQLRDACLAAFADADVLLMAAAVADFRPAEQTAEKIKKAGKDELTVRLEPTDDVLSALSAQRRPAQTLVGFAAETGAQAIAYGRGKLERKGLDAVVVNDVAKPGIGFDTPENEVTILTAAGDEHVGQTSKQEIARAILRAVSNLRTRTRETA
jgi:phosphopantothenoylcysteine decarboxylase/phosphopantothenate--cysteine ligase